MRVTKNLFDSVLKGAIPSLLPLQYDYVKIDVSEIAGADGIN